MPPFFGPRMIEKVSVKTLMPYLNETMLFQFHWGYRKLGKRKEEFDAWAQKELRPIIARIAEQCIREEILKPQAIYGYWHAAAEGNDLILFGENKAEVARFTLPRQNVPGGLCIADFFRDVDDAERDVIGLLAEGMRNKEIAAELGISEDTVEVHLKHIFGKLAVRDRTAAVTAAHLGLKVIVAEKDDLTLWDLATTFITLLPIAALFVFGGSTLKDFAFAILIGVASGVPLLAPELPVTCLMRSVSTPQTVR